MFGLLPNTLVAYVLEFLNFKDYFAVTITSKRFFHIIHDHRKFWTRECLRFNLSFDLEAYSEIYDCEEYKIHIQLKSLTYQQPSSRKLMMDGLNAKRLFGEALSNFGSQDRVESFLTYFYETLKQPLLPLANLKRETMLCHTQTIFQNKLSEVLYEDSGMLAHKMTFPSEHEEFINELLNYQDKILNEAMFCDKDHIIKARWYSLDSSDSGDLSPQEAKFLVLKGLGNSSVPSKSLDSTNDDVQSVKNNALCLLDIYYCLCNTISHFCATISHHLNSLDNTYDLLAEYAARWNTYVSTMLELEQTFKAFSEIMNKSYEHVFQGHPCYPKFSIWRLMTKIWLKEVYEKSNFNFSLNESFLRILGNHREMNVKESLNTNFLNLKIEDNSDEIPKCLYVNLKTKNKKKSVFYQDGSQQLQNVAPSCLDSYYELEKKLLSSFMQSILDLSLTEVSIHYLDCTEISANYPYSEVEDALLQKSNEFYHEYQQLFRESPDHFCHFLKSDCSLISEIIPQKTNIKLETIQVQNGLQFNKEFILNQLDTITESHLQQCTNDNILVEYNDGLNEFIESFIAEGIQEHTRGQESSGSNFYSLPPIELEDEDKHCCEEENQPIYSKYTDISLLIKKLVKFFDSTYPNFKSNFEYLRQRLQEFEKIRENDKYIKDHNTGKNIPFEMGDVDRLFYDLDKNVDVTLLQKLSEDYNAFVNDEDKDNSRNLDLPSLEDVMEQNGNRIDDFGMDPNFLDFNNIDLMNLPNPGLRRAPI